MLIVKPIVQKSFLLYHCHYCCRDTKGGYLPLVEMKPHESCDGCFLTSLHSVMKLVSQSVSRSQLSSCFFLSGPRLRLNLTPPVTWCSLQVHGTIFLWKYLFTRYRKYLWLRVLNLGKTQDLPFPHLWNMSLLGTQQINLVQSKLES